LVRRNVLILHAIEHKMRLYGDHCSFLTVNDIFSNHQHLTIEFNFKGQRRVQRKHQPQRSSIEFEH